MVNNMNNVDLKNDDNYEVINDGIKIHYRGHIHVIEEGDTLYSIARKYDLKLSDIMRLNPYINVYNLNIGDELLIPSVEKIAL